MQRRRVVGMAGTPSYIDRKRGDFWMQTGKINEDAIVYSYGELYFMQGWILFSLAMSITA